MTRLKKCIFFLTLRMKALKKQIRNYFVIEKVIEKEVEGKPRKIHHVHTHKACIVKKTINKYDLLYSVDQMRETYNYILNFYIDAIVKCDQEKAEAYREMMRDYIILIQQNCEQGTEKIVQNAQREEEGAKPNHNMGEDVTIEKPFQ